jgi:hypothetical protein
VHLKDLGNFFRMIDNDYLFFFIDDSKDQPHLLDKEKR